MKEKSYKCRECGKKITTSKEEPVCCGELMKQLSLEPCDKPAHPSHARPMDEEEPCDEGRGKTR